MTQLLSKFTLLNIFLYSPLLTATIFSKTIKQSWNQQDGQGIQEREREFLIHTPHTPKGKLPVLIIFHGNGGNGRQNIFIFKKNYPEISKKFMIISPNGYERSWNIVAEKSRAPDVNFIKKITTELRFYRNVDVDNINLYGMSNGSGLVNNLLIQFKILDVKIKRAITEASQLNTKQYSRNSFWSQGEKNQYREKSSPLKGTKILALSGEQDRIIPYYGGESRIPANYSHTKRLKFLSAEDSIFTWAKAMGYKGKKIDKRKYSESISFVSYLDGNVSHYSFAREGHGIRDPKKKKIIRDFLTSK